jgi:hypothetical protein
LSPYPADFRKSKSEQQQTGERGMEGKGMDIAQLLV